MKELTPSDGILCANCATPLQGEFCHECGQSVKSVIRPVSGMLEDAMDIAFHVDERVIHTLPPLYVKPGFLTLEYFAGRRVRYVAPFRLMFVFCLLSFFLLHLAIESSAGSVNLGPSTVGAGAFADAKTADQVRVSYNEQSEDNNKAINDPVIPEAAKAGLRVANETLLASANARLAQLGAPPISAPAATAPATAHPLEQKLADAGQTKAQRSRWLDKNDPIHIAWLPDMANARLTVAVNHMRTNINQMDSKNPTESHEAASRMIDGAFSVLPQTMFFMLPVFALLLKVVYLFRRRLYMEHIIVSLHSHAFLFLSLFLMILTGMVADWVQPHAAWLGSGLYWLIWAMAAWIPVYLLLTQKRVYRQGWPMTLLKFWFVGSCYFWLLGFALVAVMLITLAH
jgi:Protein of unknown function (DUF3667)